MRPSPSKISVCRGAVFGRILVRIALVLPLCSASFIQEFSCLPRPRFRCTSFGKSAFLSLSNSTQLASAGFLKCFLSSALTVPFLLVFLVPRWLLVPPLLASHKCAWACCGPSQALRMAMTVVWFLSRGCCATTCTMPNVGRTARRPDNVRGTCPRNRDVDLMMFVENGTFDSHVRYLGGRFCHSNVVGDGRVFLQSDPLSL